ncbi:hypothetical protein [Ralstonia sp. ASV6]|uniref:hypothetical protein n=1 Tax=Ralstonia sp. ASV6 TaxID=2795124 RepID=UPI0018ED5D0E|nr:hypothetical protein [Ralstonia sp. ASV6]
MQTPSIQSYTGLRERDTGREFVVTDVSHGFVFYRARVGKIVGEIMCAYVDEVFEVVAAKSNGADA